MATRITAPAPYSSVLKPVLFQFSRTSTFDILIRINNYLKQLPRGADRVDVSQYYKQEFNILPITAPRSNATFTLYDGIEHARVTEAMISIDEAVSKAVPLLWSMQDPMPDYIMSPLVRRVIARGEVDEIPVYLTGPAQLAYGTERIALPAGISFVTFRVPQNAPEQFQVVLQYPDGEVLDTIRYELGAPGVRLAWINVYGAVDFWNFPVIRKSETKVKREKIYTAEGYLPTQTDAETIHTVISQHLPKASAEAVGHILRSDRAWRVNGTALQPIDIVSEVVTEFETDKLSSVQIEFRNKIHA